MKEFEKKLAAVKATEYIKDNSIIGLGTGSTAYYMIEEVGRMIRAGMSLKAVATSASTTDLADRFNIPILSIDEVDRIDIAIDGVDEIDSSFNAIKGGGGALFREKIVANLSKEVIWIMDSSKLVDNIGAFALPVEILRYGYSHTLRTIKNLGYSPNLRLRDEAPFVTDNGNYILDLDLGAGFNIQDVSQSLNAIDGVLVTGLFLNLCDRVIVGEHDGFRVIENNNRI